MIPSPWRRFLRRFVRPSRPSRDHQRQARLAVELLEDRATPATLMWTGATNTSWGTATNWSPNQVPAVNDTLVFDTAAVGVVNFTSVNNLTNFTVGNIVINDTSATGDFNISGNPIFLGLGITHSLTAGTATTIGLGSITPNGPQTFLNNAGQLTISSPIPLGTHELRADGAGNTTLSGTISGAAAASGLKGDYFNLSSGQDNDNLFNPALPASYLGNRTPTVSVTTPTINFPSSDTNPLAPIGVNIGNDMLAGRWTGNITIPTTGNYIFFTTSDDGSVLLVDGVLVVNNGGSHPMQTVQGTRSLTAGVHTIEVMWYEGGGGAGIIVEWDPEGAVTRQILPAAVLSRVGNDVTKVGKFGSGTLTLSGNNSYGAATSVQAGMLVAASTNALGSTTGSTVVANGATLGLPGGVTLGGEAITATGDGVGGLGAIRSLSGNNTMTGTLRVEASNVVPVLLQNAAAAYSQGGWPAANLIDGNLTSGSGWANDGNPTDSNVAVFETATDLGAGQLQFTFTFTFGGEHFLGKFRLSVTTDDRSTFADSLDNGGDVIANWIELTPSSATSASGTTLTINADKSILASGTMPGTEVYTVRATLPSGGITGIRLEALTDPSLPTNGPGRASNGNYVLNELQVGHISGTSVIGVDAGSLALNGTMTSITGSQGTFHFTGAGNTVVNGAIIGLGTGVIKSGAGNLTLNSNSNTYAAGTTISGGTMLVNNGLGSGTGTGPVTVQAGGTLSGTGSISGNLTADPGSFVTPGGAGPDELTIGGNLGLAGTFNVQLNGPGAAQFDQLIVGQPGQNKLLNVSGTLSGTLGFTLAVGETVTIISNVGTGSVTGLLNTVLDGGVITVGGQDLLIHYNAGDGNDVVLEGFINVPPTLPTNNPLTVLEGGPGTIGLSWLRAQDVQEDADQITFTVTISPTNGTLRKSGLAETTFTQADINGGLISYLHDGSETTSDSFGFEVTDGHATIGPFTFSITVTPQNDAPLITDGTSIGVTMSEDAVPTAFSLTLNSTDVDSPAAARTWSISSQGSGAASVNPPTSGASASINYVPVANFRGSDSFVVQVSDGAGGSATITVNVTIEAVNDAPVASSAGNLSTPYLVPGTIDLRTLVSDLETLDDDLDFTVGAPVNGTVTLLADGYTAQFSADSQGPASFTFSVTDTGDGASGALSANDVPVSVTVLPPLPAPPVANNDSYGIDENTHLIGNVITDVGGADTDVNGDTLVIKKVNGRFVVGKTIRLLSGARLTVQGDGSFDYNPTTSGKFNRLQLGQTATDSFSYRISDGHGGFDKATVFITVNGVNDAPFVPAAKTFRGWKNTPKTISLARLLRGSRDPEGVPLIVQNVSAPSLGTLVVNANGSVTITPPPDFLGQITFTYEVTDGVNPPQTVGVTLKIRRRP